MIGLPLWPALQKAAAAWFADTTRPFCRQYLHTRSLYKSLELPGEIDQHTTYLPLFTPKRYLDVLQLLPAAR